MNLDSLSRHRNIGYAVIVITFIVVIMVFRPAIFPQASGDGGATLYPSRSPTSPTDVDNVIVSLTKADKASGKLTYTAGFDDPVIVEMTVSGDKWSGTIPKKSVDTLVSYIVRLYDEFREFEWSKEYSYTVKTSSTIPPGQTYSATFIIYNDVDGEWVVASLGDTISGRIKIDLTVTEGSSYVTRASMRFLKQNEAGDWVMQDEVSMVSVAGDIAKYTITYDTTKLANAVYDIWYDLYAGSTHVYTESLFSIGDGADLDIDPDIVMLGLAGIVGIFVLMVLLKKRKK